MKDSRPSDRKDMPMKQCETTQNDVLLAGEGIAIPKQSLGHLETCSACRDFYKTLGGLDKLIPAFDEPPARLDRAVLSYARRRPTAHTGRRLNLPPFIRYAMAASLAALLSLAAWQAFHPDLPTGAGGPLIAEDGTTLSKDWQADDLTAALGGMVATASTADKAEEQEIDILFADESSEAVADIIEDQLAEIQADLYYASLTFDEGNE